MNAVILPAHNEEKAIGDVIRSIKCHSPESAIILVDSACTDNTVIIAKSHGVKIIRASKGKGKAIGESIKYIWDYDKVVMLDSDHTYPETEINNFYDQLRLYDVVVGVRRLIPGANISWLGYFGNRFITAQAQFLYSSSIPDLCTGMWGFNKRVVEQLNIKSTTFTLEAELLVFCAKHKLHLGFIPIPYYSRVGKSHINRMDHLKIMAYLWRHIFD